MTRDDRQTLVIKRWVATKGKACVECCTGFGKTRVALRIIALLQAKKPLISIKILVPTTSLQLQWKEEIKAFKLKTEHIKVEVMMGASQRKDECDLLIIDECHRIASEVLSASFQNIKYTYILCLTATLERLDARHTIITQYAPICDSVSTEEALQQGWISPYKEYLVLIDVDDIQDFKDLNKQFIKVFEFFDMDFNLAMSCVGPKGYKNCIALRDKLCTYDATPAEKSSVLKDIKVKAALFMRILQKRKSFIANHPKKIEIAKKIIDARKDKKIVTFCKTVKMAEEVCKNFVYTGDKGKKNNKATLDKFNKQSSGVLSTSKMAQEGLDCPDLSVGICLDVDSSKIKAKQILGRVVRKHGDKQAEFFTIVINNCVEVQWWQKSHQDAPNIIKIDEEGLEKVLKGEIPDTISNLQHFYSRF